MPNTTKYRVVELRDPRKPDLPRYVQATRQGESPWRTLWEHRDEIDNRLTAWFKELAAFHLEEIARMSGTHSELPDFIVNERVNRGGRGKSRPVVHIDSDGKLTRFASLSAAARAEGVDRSAISRRPGRMAGWVDG